MKRIMGCLVLAALTLNTAAWAADYPTKPITLVVPYTAGGPTDQMARSLAQGLAEQLKTPVVVDNKPGAHTSIGTGYVANASADGYTLLMASNGSMILNPLLYKKTPYKLTDFKIFAIATEAPLVVVVNPKLKVHNIQELISYSKTVPKGLNYSSVGQGSPLHLATEILNEEAKMNMTHVPYNGTAQALTAVAAGDVDLMSDVVSTSLPLISANKVRPIAVTTSERLKLLADVPTVAESGFPGFHVATWFGLAVHKDVPAAVTEKLHKAAYQVITSEDFRKRFEALGLIVQNNQNQQQVDQFVQADLAGWKRIVDLKQLSLD